MNKSTVAILLQACCTSKLGVGLFDVTQGCDQLLAGDWLLILQQVPETATKTSLLHSDFVPLQDGLGAAKVKRTAAFMADKLQLWTSPLCYKPQLIGQYVGIRSDSCDTARHVSAR